MKISSFLFFIFFLVCSNIAHAGLYTQYSAGYISEQDAETSFDFSLNQLQNDFFLGVSFGPNGRIVFGQSLKSWSRTVEREYNLAGITENKVSFFEMGPRLQYFLNQNKNFYIAAAYHFHVKGSREVDGGEEDLRGSSMHLAFGIQMPLSRNLFLGLSMNYFSQSIDESIQANVTTEIDEGYTFYYPSFELSYRWGSSRRGARNSWPSSWRR